MISLPYGTTVYRLRARSVYDPVSDSMVEGDWGTPDSIAIPEAFIAQSSTASVPGATRTQVLESKSLFCAPDADVQMGDRIQDGEGGPIYPVDGVPAADVNPFTGWQPVREVPLQRAVG